MSVYPFFLKTGGSVTGYVDASAGLRSTGLTAYASGAGAEVQYSGGNANFLGFDRTGGAYIPVRLLGSTISLLIGGTSSGLTFTSGGNATFTNNVTVSGSANLGTTSFAGGVNSVVFGSQVLGSVLTWGTDATYDIGAPGANRPRSLYLSAGAVMGGPLTATGPSKLNGSGNSGTTAASWRFGDTNSGSSRDWAISNGYGAGALDIGALNFTVSAAANGDPIANTAGVALRMTLSSAVFAGSVKSVGAFGCNNATPQTSVASGGALAAYVTGTAGLDTGAHMQALYNLVVAMRTALVNNGIMS